MRDLAAGNNGEMLRCFMSQLISNARSGLNLPMRPLPSCARCVYNCTVGYDSLSVVVVPQYQGTIATLFVSYSNGTYFVESLRDTNRNGLGYGLANVVSNSEDVEAHRSAKRLQSRIYYDDGHTWFRLRPPSEDSEGRRIAGNPADDKYSLHLNSVALPLWTCILESCTGFRDGCRKFRIVPEGLRGMRHVP